MGLILASIRYKIKSHSQARVYDWSPTWGGREILLDEVLCSRYFGPHREFPNDRVTENELSVSNLIRRLAEFPA